MTQPTGPHSSDKQPADGPRRALLRALVALLPTVAGRGSLGFTAVDREDAVMEAIVRALEFEQSFEAERVPVDAVALRYALRVVQNRLLDELRRERRERSAVIEMYDDSGNVLDESRPSAARLLRERVANELVTSLLPAERALLEAYLLSPESFHTEIVRQQLQPGTARVRIHRLLRRLRERGRRLLAEESGQRR